MAVTTDTIKQSYPLPAYNYRVTILPLSLNGLDVGGTVAAAAGTAISCSEVSGLSMEIETVTYRDGYSFITGDSILPGQRKEVNLAIKKGVTINSIYFSDWMSLLYPIIAAAPANQLQKRDVVIDLCDEQGFPLVRWMAIGAMPTKLEAPSFDANTNEVAFERLDLIAFQLQVQYLNSP